MNLVKYYLPVCLPLELLGGNRPVPVKLVTGLLTAVDNGLADALEDSNFLADSIF